MRVNKIICKIQVLTSMFLNSSKVNAKHVISFISKIMKFIVYFRTLAISLYYPSADALEHYKFKQRTQVACSPFISIYFEIKFEAIIVMKIDCIICRNVISLEVCYHYKCSMPMTYINPICLFLPIVQDLLLNFFPL